MGMWFGQLALYLLWAYLAVANLHQGDFMKPIVAGIALVIIGHLAYGAWRGLLWIASALILADLKAKLKKEE